MIYECSLRERSQWEDGKSVAKTTFFTTQTNSTKNTEAKNILKQTLICLFYFHNYTGVSIIGISSKMCHWCKLLFFFFCIHQISYGIFRSSVNFGQANDHHIVDDWHFDAMKDSKHEYKVYEKQPWDGGVMITVIWLFNLCVCWYLVTNIPTLSRNYKPLFWSTSFRTCPRHSYLCVRRTVRQFNRLHLW